MSDGSPPKVVASRNSSSAVPRRLFQFGADEDIIQFIITIDRYQNSIILEVCGMDLRQLECFVAVAEELHFGRAAERLHMAQPPLSRHIINLESELGARLFTRSSRSVELTEMGAALLAEAKLLVNGVRALPELVRQVRDGSSGSLRLGAVGPAMDGCLAEIIRAFLKRNAGTELSVRILGTERQIEEVRKNRLHVGFIRPYEHAMEDLERRIVAAEPYVLALPGEHRLAQRSRVRLAELDGENLVFFPRDTHPRLYDAVLGRLYEAGARVRVTQEADSKGMIIAMVSAGLGVGVVPASSARARRRDVKFVKIAGALPSVEICAVWKRESHSGVLERFVAALPAAAVGA